MKLTEEEVRVVAALRALDSQQRKDIVAYIHRQLLANKVTARVAGLAAVNTIANRKVERAFGRPPTFRGGTK